MAPAPAVAVARPDPVIEHATLAPVDVYTTPAPVIELMPAPVIEYIAPPPAEFYPSFSQQSPPACTNEAVAVEASAPQDVGSLLSLG